MKNIFLLGLILNTIFINIIVSQQYTPLQFRNYTPLWTHIYNTNKMPIQSGNWIILEQNFYRAPLVIDDGILYNVYNIAFGPAWLGGYYLEAIDIESGKLIWDQVYYSEKVGEKRYANRPIIHGDTLELLIHEEYNKSDTFFKPIWFTASARRIIIDKRNGVIIGSTFGVPKDTNARRIPLPFPYGPTHLYFNDTNFIVINHLVLTDTLTGKSGIWYNRIVLDSTNKEIGNSELYIQTDYNKVSDGLFNYDDNKIFCAYNSETHPDSSKQDVDFGYYYMDRRLNIQTSNKLNEIKAFDVNRCGPAFVAEDYFIIASSFYQENPYWWDTKDLVLFDRFGTSIEKIDLRNLKINSINVSYMHASLVKTTKGPRILFSVQSRATNTVEFYISDGSGNYSKTNSFILDLGRKTEISLTKLDIVGDNVLCNFIYRENAAGLNEAPLLNSWIMIKGNDIGILTKNKDEVSDEETIMKMAPNPVKSIITIKFDKPYSGLLNIYNELGQLLLAEELHNEIEYVHNVSNLTSGNYNIQFMTNNKLLKGQFIKVY